VEHLTLRGRIRALPPLHAATQQQQRRLKNQNARPKLSEEDINEDAEKEALCHRHDLSMITRNKLLPERGALPLSPRLEGVDLSASKRTSREQSTSLAITQHHHMKPLPSTYLPPPIHDHRPCISRRRLHGGDNARAPPPPKPKHWVFTRGKAVRGRGGVYLNAALKGATTLSMPWPPPSVKGFPRYKASPSASPTNHLGKSRAREMDGKEMEG
jgi:hypothetical protein